MMKRIKYLIILTLLVASCVGTHAQQLNDSVRVRFKVNNTVIDTLLSGNNIAMRNFAKRIKKLTSNDSITLTINSILITGAASPEGSIAINEHLSRERATAITKWLKGYLEFPDTLPQFIFKGRDWQGLLKAVKKDANVPYRNEVVSLLENIINTPPSSNYKKDNVGRLKALRKGKPYYYMWRNIFPTLRASEVFIDITTRPIPRPVADTIGEQCDRAVGCVSVEPSSPIDTVINSNFLTPSRGGYAFAIKTNALYDVLAIPNIGVEFPIGNHFSIGANWMYAWWHKHARNRHWRIYGGDINARYYLNNNEHSLTGHHFGVYGQVLVFQIAFGGKGYITGIPGENIWGKPYFGGGLEYGYSKQLSRRFNIDFSLGLGFMLGEYREYRPIDDHYVWQSTHRRNWFGPTKAEISLVWLIGKLPQKQKGGDL